MSLHPNQPGVLQVVRVGDAVLSVMLAVKIAETDGNVKVEVLLLVLVLVVVVVVVVVLLLVCLLIAVVSSKHPNHPGV